MNSIIIIICNIVFLFYGGRYFFLMYYLSKKLEEIHKLEARAAVLRTILKSRVKKKVNVIRSQLAHEKVLLEEVGPKYDLASELQFTNSQDFQSLLNIMKDISIRMEQHIEQQEREADPVAAEGKHEQRRKETQDRMKHSLQEADPESEIWRTVIKHEKTNILIIKDLVQTTLELRSKIGIYNIDVEVEKKKLKTPELISFQKFDLICTLAEEESLTTEDDPLKKSSINLRTAA